MTAKQRRGAILTAALLGATAAAIYLTVVLKFFVYG
jgi:hypothetical protein